MVYDARHDPILEDNEHNRTILGGKKDKRINMPFFFDAHRQIQMWVKLRQMCDDAIADLKGPYGGEPLPMRSRLILNAHLIDQFNRWAREVKREYETELREARKQGENVVHMEGRTGTAE